MGASLLTFILPLTGVLGATIIAGPEPLYQLFAALGALAVGGILARGIARWMRWEDPGVKS